MFAITGITGNVGSVVARTVPESKYIRRYVQLHNLGQTPQGVAALTFRRRCRSVA